MQMVLVVVACHISQAIRLAADRTQVVALTMAAVKPVHLLMV
jgi:hypothetical protein